MPYGNVALVIRLSPRQPGYTITTCAHERRGRAKSHTAISKLLADIIEADGDVIGLGLIGPLSCAFRFCKEICNEKFPLWEELLVLL